jgi:hypothetical protein
MSKIHAIESLKRIKQRATGSRYGRVPEGGKKG